MTYILGIETSTDICSVALFDENKILSSRKSIEGLDHASKLAIFIQELFRETGIGPNELSAVAVSKGPGSYTGLRIGVSTAKGMCYTLGIPLIGIGSLESLAWNFLELHDVPSKDLSYTLCPMIDARRMEVYAQIFDINGFPLTDARAYIVDESSFSEYVSMKNNRFVIFGPGAAKCREILKSDALLYYDISSSAESLFKPACDAFRKKEFEDLAYFEPFYLKEFALTTAKKKIL